MTIEDYVKYYDRYTMDDLHILMDHLNIRYKLTHDDETVVVSDIRKRMAAIWTVLGNKERIAHFKGGL